MIPISVVLTYDILDQDILQFTDSPSMRRNLLIDTRALSTLHCVIHFLTNTQCRAILFNSQEVGNVNCQLYKESVFNVGTMEIPNNFVYFIKGK